MGADSTGVGDLGPLAGAYSKLFETSGDIQYLKDAEKVYKKAITVSSIKIQDGYKRALAKNYITQHRFKDAITLLEESYAGISNKHATELLLFDCYLEVGAYPRAEQILKKIENINQFDYLIRISKWSDHKGIYLLPLGIWKKPWLSRILEITWPYKSGQIQILQIIMDTKELLKPLTTII